MSITSILERTKQHAQPEPATQQAQNVAPRHPDGTTTGQADASQQPNRQQRRANEKTQRGLFSEVEQRNRMQLVPHYLTASLIGLAAAIHEAAVQAQTISAAAMLAGVGTAAAGTAGYLWLRKQKRLLTGWTSWYAAIGAAASAWMVCAVAVGVTWGSLVAALAAEYTLATRWWKHHRHPEPDEPAENDEPDLEVDDELIAIYKQRWAERIGCDNGVLAGSQLLGGQQFTHGIEYTIRLVGGKHDLDSVRAVLGKIASGLERPAHLLSAEPDDSENPVLVKFTLATSSPIKDVVYLRELPALRKGHIPIGPYFDGRGDATYRLYKGRRMLNGLIVGGTDSGKSRLLEQLGLVAMRTGHTYVIHVDGMNGASCPALWEYAHERYGRHDVKAVLARLEGIQAYRERQLQQQAFRPTPDYPGVLVIVDEFHRLLGKDEQPRWADLAREVNKCGMGILGADQDPTIETWGSGPLRGSLRAGNAIGLRVTERAAGRVISDVDLYKLPKRSGTGYVIDAEESGARQAMYRGRFLPDRDDAYPEDEDTEVRTTVRQVPGDVPLIEEWFAVTPRITLDVGSDQSGGQTGKSRSEADAEPAPSVTRKAEPARARLTPMALPTINAAPTPTAGSGAELTDSQYQVLDTVRLGETKPGQIANQLGLSRQRVGTVLAELAELGKVTKHGSGPSVRYEATDAEEPAAV